MLRKERQQQIVKLLQEQSMVKIKELAPQFGTSIITIRRDLDELEQNGLIKKVYGGAVLAPRKGTENQHPFFSVRTQRCHTEKQRIGAAAAALVQPNETIVLDIGTTALEIAKCLKHREDITVLTSSLPVLNELADSRLTVYSLGGLLRGNELALCGSLAFHVLNAFLVDKAFIGAGGITLENGITDYNRDSAELCAVMTQRARQTILVTDSSKFGHDASAVIGSLDSVDTIVTDNGIPQQFRDNLCEKGIQLLIADK